MDRPQLSPSGCGPLPQPHPSSVKETVASKNISTSPIDSGLAGVLMIRSYKSKDRHATEEEEKKNRVIIEIEHDFWKERTKLRESVHACKSKECEKDTEKERIRSDTFNLDDD